MNKISSIYRVLFVAPTSNVWIQLFRSLFVGGVATVADFVVTAIARDVFGAGDIVSNISGFVVGLVVNYLISIFWVFKKHNMNMKKEFVIFTCIGLVGLAINTSIVWLLVKLNIWFYIAKVIATLVTLIWNFAARKIILYK